MKERTLTVYYARKYLFKYIKREREKKVKVNEKKEERLQLC
jgi:hypothetical protein